MAQRPSGRRYPDPATARVHNPVFVTRDASSPTAALTWSIPGPHRAPPPATDRGPRCPAASPAAVPLDGWLIIDKPPGLTSTDVVNRVRRAFDAQKAGHGGTLDPLATGVLPIAFGAATKTVPYVMDGTKLYRFTLRFGEARDTDDADGQVTATSRRARPTTQIRAALPRIPRRHHAGPADLLGGEGRRRARLRHGPRGPRRPRWSPARPGWTASS